MQFKKTTRQFTPTGGKMRTFRTSFVTMIVGSALALAACGGSADGDSEGKGGDVRIGVSFYTKAIPLYTQLEAGMRAKAKELGAELEFAYADNSAETQSNQINTFVTKGVDVILASPLDTKALVPAYQQAQQAGVPVVSVANKLDDKDEDAYVGPDLADQAQRTMDKVIEGMGGSGEVLLLTGPPQIAFVQLQKLGWDKSLAKHPDVTVAATLVVPDMTSSSAVDVATSGLTSNPGVTGMIGSLDDISLGAIQAAKDLKIDPAKLYIAGWDGGPAAITAVKDGSYDLTLSQRGFTWGSISVETAIAIAKGEKLADHRVDVPDLFIDAQNIKTVTEADMK